MDDITAKKILGALESIDESLQGIGSVLIFLLIMLTVVGGCVAVNISSLRY